MERDDESQPKWDRKVAAPGGYRMPWGKHRGEDIQTVPRAYLVWLTKRIRGESFRSVKKACDAELRRRTQKPKPKQ